MHQKCARPSITEVDHCEQLGTMKVLFLTALIVAVASSPLTENPKWPWQVGKEYVYDVNSYTWTKFDNSDTIGNAFKTQFIVRVKAPGHLLAKLEYPIYAQMQVNSDIEFDPVDKFDQSFEIFVDGGRVLSVNVPSTLSLTNENILKGLISALQVDLSTYGHVHSFPNSYDKESFQGLFKKMEEDVTGDCETLYSISPVSAEWRRELPDFAEEPIEITKSKNYGSCKKRISYDFGVPEGTIWKGIAQEDDEKQFIKHTSETRMLVGKQGAIYKSDVMSSVFVNPLLFGKQKAEVYSYIGFKLTSIQTESSTEWQKSEEFRKIDSLLFTMTETNFIQVDAQNVAKAQALLQNITPLLNDPRSLSMADFLSKFNILVRYIYSMSPEQLTLMTSSIDIAKSSKDAAKYKMWVIYRDAVAQSGSVAAFKEIKNWILTKKVQGEEAAEIIGSMAVSLRNSTKEIMNEFFDLALRPEVREQMFLNTSTLLAATKFIRFGQKEELFVVDKVIPRLSQELTQAIEKGENSTALVFVRVLGNLAYPEILEVFAPYLEGHIPVSNYLRTQMVISLKTLANMKNEYVRAVLFSILKNTAESYEVRVAAALNIFMAYPTSEMMQIMARMTLTDPSAQVRGVLSTSIKFAANLKDPRFAELAKNAQAVLHEITTVKYGDRYSTDSLIDEYTSSDEIAHFRELSYIGSENSALPKYHRSALRLRGNGLTEEDWMTLSVSDVQQLVDYFMQKLFQHAKEDVDFKFSAKKIFEILNIKRQTPSPIEGSLFIDALNQQKLFAFTEQELADYIPAFAQYLKKLITGDSSQYTKLLINKPVFVTFPLATGMPFVFKYSEPIAINVQVQTSSKFTVDDEELLKTDIKFAYARNLDGSVGFLDTLSEVYASTGIVNKLEFQIPAKLTTEVESNEIQLSFELPEQDVTLVHLSVWPYTTLQKQYSPVVVNEDPTTKLIERPAKVLSTELNLGQPAGVALLLKGFSYSKDFQDIYAYDMLSLYGDNLLTYVRDLLYQNDVALTIFELKYLAKETKNKAVTYNFFIDTLYDQDESGEFGPAIAPSDITPNSKARRGEMAKRVASGIESATVDLVDISAVFDGEQKVDYVLTAALASSPVDNKVQAAVFAKGTEQINAVFKITKPKITPLDFGKALKNEIKAFYEADIKFNNNFNVKFNVIGERSQEYTEKLLNDRVGRQCLQESSTDNFYQKNCYKMIIKAHAPDFFKGTVTYDKLSPNFVNLTKNIYQILKNRYDWDEEVDFLKTVEDGKIEVEAQAFYYENYINYNFTTKYGVLRLKNKRSLHHYPYSMAFYYPLSYVERANNWYDGYQYMPFCSVDNSMVWTFGGRSYDYTLTGSWHVVMADESKVYGNDLVILARRPSDNQEEVYISYNTVSGKYVEVEIKPTSVEVNSNVNKITEGDLTTYSDSSLKDPLFEYYTLAEGIQLFSLGNGAIRMIYDRQRLVIYTDNHRTTTTGICGQSTTQDRDDYMTPYGLVTKPEYYGASFSLEGEFSDPKTVELKKEAKLKAYQPVTKYTNIFRSDAEWSKAENESIKGLYKL